MYSFEDENIIRHALKRRLDTEKGIKVMEIHVKDHTDHIKVGVELIADDLVHITSRFDLPPQFELGHIHNEADEIAEQCKEAKRVFALRICGMAQKNDISERFDAKGTGVRGNWRRYGERTNA